MELASDRALPNLRTSKHPGRTDLVFHTGQLPADIDAAEVRRQHPLYKSRIRDSSGVPRVQVWRFSASGHYFFEYSEGVAFVLDGGGGQLWARWEGSVTEDLVSELLVGQILSIVLHLRGYACMHASAVVIDGRAVLFAGPQGSGKSSTAAAFAEHGQPVLSDDIAPIGTGPSGELIVMPGLARISLWPDSVDFLYGPGAADQFPRLQEQEEKRLLRLDAARGKFQDQPVRLGAVYLLAPRSGAPNAPWIEPLGTAERLVQLLPNGFASSALDPEQRSREFQIQGEISRSVPVQRIVPSVDPEKLADLCDLVLNEVRSASLI